MIARQVYSGFHFGARGNRLPVLASGSLFPHNRYCYFKPGHSFHRRWNFYLVVLSLKICVRSLKIRIVHWHAYSVQVNLEVRI